MFSLYSLPSTAVKSQPLQAVNAAYLFYYATDQTPSTRDLGDGSTAHKAINWKDESEEDRKGLKLRLDALIGDALVCSQKVRSSVSPRVELAATHGVFSCRQLGFDVLNALTLQDNSLFLEDLKVSSVSLQKGTLQSLTRCLGKRSVWSRRVSSLSGCGLNFQTRNALTRFLQTVVSSTFTSSEFCSAHSTRDRALTLVTLVAITTRNRSKVESTLSLKDPGSESSCSDFSRRVYQRTVRRKRMIEK